MAGISNTVLNPGTGGDAIIDILDTNGKKWPVSAIAVCDSAGTPGTLVQAASPFPVRVCDGSGFVTVPVATQLPAALGQTTMSASLAVVIASNQSAIPISVASLPLPAGAALDATLTGGTATTRLTDGTNTATVKAASTAAGATDKALVVAISPNNTVPISAASLPALSGTTAVSIAATVATSNTQLPAALVSGRLDENVGAWLGSTAPTVGSKVSASSVPVVIASDQGNVPVTLSGSPAISGTVTSNQGTANSAANRWPVTVSDGTNSMPTGDAVARALFTKTTDGTNTAAVKAASTAAAAADPALVVSVSPNSVVTINEVSSVTASACARQTVGTSSGSILASNTSRKRAIVTNVGIFPIYLGLGQTPTTAAYHVALSACSNSADDGSGGVYVLDIWDGAINAICGNAAGAVSVVEMT